MSLASTELQTTEDALTALCDLAGDLERAKSDARALPAEIARAMLEAGVFEVFDHRFGCVWQLTVRRIAVNNTPLPGTMVEIGKEE